MSESRRKGTWDRRGNNADRRARKLWMLAMWGNGTTCKCVHCGEVVNYETVQADRIQPGGSYKRVNVQPACQSCNILRSNDPHWIAPNKQKKVSA